MKLNASSTSRNASSSAAQANCRTSIDYASPHGTPKTRCGSPDLLHLASAVATGLQKCLLIVDLDLGVDLDLADSTFLDRPGPSHHSIFQLDLACPQGLLFGSSRFLKGLFLIILCPSSSKVKNSNRQSNLTVL
eukprot:CAMPEP_0172773078 /NCGR_PEP_ID=MMETSP1074-20121228/193615_1 /TAXON_ID=2916 /ORGANISM="Ceratium fusus, Strain PA161109" /LENGTH=133 /DNA_ID=CAMNT_0013609305 /DNA_START=439 /DNA_END=837 /DNA_ORIENTATION=-